jgi:hypothetical protein
VVCWKRQSESSVDNADEEDVCGVSDLRDFLEECAGLHLSSAITISAAFEPPIV